MHSHMTAVRQGLEACGVGCALKLWQHRLCLGHGIVGIRWMLVPIHADYDALRRVDLVGALVGVPA